MTLDASEKGDGGGGGGGGAFQVARGRGGRLPEAMVAHIDALAPGAGSGADEDIVVASARAYVAALNKMIGFISASKAGGRGAAEGSSSVGRGGERPAVEGVAVPAGSA